MTQTPDHNWQDDPRVTNALRDVRSVTRAHFNQFTKDAWWKFDGPIVDVLDAVRDEYGMRCMDYSDADWDNRSHVTTAWCNSLSVDDVIDAALRAPAPLELAA